MYMQLIETSGMTLGISDISDYNILCNWCLRDKNQNVLIYLCISVDTSHIVIEYFAEYTNFKIWQD